MSNCLSLSFIFYLALTLRLGSLVWLAYLLFSDLPSHSLRSDFHVQLSYRFLIRDWESFFSRIQLTLISKSPGGLLRSASFNSD